MPDLSDVLAKESTKNKFLVLRNRRRPTTTIPFYMGTIIYLEDDNEIRKFLLEELPGPWRIDIRDVVDAVTEILIVPDAKFGVAYQHFCETLCRQAAAVDHRSDPIIFDVDNVESAQVVTDDSPDGIVIWRSGSGFEVRIAAIDPSAKQVHVIVQGRASSRAFSRAVSELKTILASVFRSCTMLQRAFLEGAYALRFTEDIQENCLIEDGELAAQFGYIPRMLDAYFAPAGAKRGIVERIRIALQLLVEADEQRVRSLGVALCVSAIEALVCRARENVSKTVQEHYAALLEPLPEFRDRAQKCISRLYGIRSNVFHGNDLDALRSDWAEARLWAAAAVTSFVDRATFQTRMELPDEDIEVFLKELSEGKVAPGQPVGVEFNPVCLIWRDCELEPYPWDDDDYDERPARSEQSHVSSGTSKREGHQMGDIRFFPFPNDDGSGCAVVTYDHRNEVFVSTHKHVKDSDGNTVQVPLGEISSEDSEFMKKCRDKVVDELRSQGRNVKTT